MKVTDKIFNKIEKIVGEEEGGVEFDMWVEMLEDGINTLSRFRNFIADYTGWGSGEVNNYVDDYWDDYKKLVKRGKKR